MLKCNGQIPQYCADKFEDHTERLARIEGNVISVCQKLDIMAEQRKTFADRAWGITKGCALLVIGWFLATNK